MSELVNSIRNTEEEHEHTSLDPQTYPPSRPPHALPNTSEGERPTDGEKIEQAFEGGKTPTSAIIFKKESRPSEKALSDRQASDSHIITPKLNESSSSNLSLFRVTAPYAFRNS